MDIYIALRIIINNSNNNKHSEDSIQRKNNPFQTIRLTKKKKKTERTKQNKHTHKHIQKTVYQITMLYVRFAQLVKIKC